MEGQTGLCNCRCHSIDEGAEHLYRYEGSGVEALQKRVLGCIANGAEQGDTEQGVAEAPLAFKSADNMLRVLQSKSTWRFGRGPGDCHFTCLRY